MIKKQITINGFTKESMKEVIEKEFKGKAIENERCQYLTVEGKKCAVGCFIPQGHESLNEYYDLDAYGLAEKFPDLKNQYYPLDARKLGYFQHFHDTELDENSSLEHQKMQLLEWIDDNIA